MSKERKPSDVPPKVAVSARNLLGPKLRRERFPELFSSASKECRWRAEGWRNRSGDILQWYPINGTYYVYEDEVTAWIQGSAIKSTAELAKNFHGNRYQHLESARAKAMQLRKDKALEPVQRL